MFHRYTDLLILECNRNINSSTFAEHLLDMNLQTNQKHPTEILNDKLKHNYNSLYDLTNQLKPIY